ncbi:MAG: hypothetical protein PHH36_09105, partial [Sideroxydans sp.]|nr:hypothetical protein [Sideroxydans sp.]
SGVVFICCVETMGGIKTPSGTDGGRRASSEQHLRAVRSPERPSHAGEGAACKANSPSSTQLSYSMQTATGTGLFNMKCKADPFDFALEKTQFAIDSALHDVLRDFGQVRIPLSEDAPDAGCFSDYLLLAGTTRPAMRILCTAFFEGA